MKATIIMDVKKIKNKLTGKMIEITPEIAKDENFRKAVEINLKEICKGFENYYLKKGIICSLKYRFDG